MSDTEKSAQAQPNESAEPSFRYNAKLAQGIEEKWQKIWDDEGAFWAANVNGDLKDGTSATRWATSPPMWSAATTA